MARQVTPPFISVKDVNGLPYVGAKLFVFQAGTTTPLAVYTDDALTIPAANPATSNAAGNFPRLYVAEGTYKLRCQDASGVLIWEYDNIDSGLSSGGAALPISQGGTGATTAAAARTNLGAAAASAVSDMASDVATLQADVDALPEFGELASLDTVTQQYLPDGSVVDSATIEYTNYAAINQLIPLDDTIPQIGEGFELFSTTFSPKSSTNKLRVSLQGWFTAANNALIAALFVNGAADAVKVGAALSTGPTDFANFGWIGFTFSPGTTAAVTLAIRVGGVNNNVLAINGSNTPGARYFGGKASTTLLIEEIKA